MFKKSIHLFLCFMLVGSLLLGQTSDEKINFFHAEELRKSYHFTDAIALYKEIFSKTIDTNFQKTITAQIASSENGIKMLEYGIAPRVYGHITVPQREFFLYYPDLKDSTWIQVPYFLNRNIRDYPINNVMVYRMGENTMYFSAQDKDGNWDIYSTNHLDGTIWSIPQPLSDTVNSPGDELFPVISADGKKLYFSSNGQSGMGGFDTYVCIWDEKLNGWGVPQNLGFPYSSPEDDFLFINTASGNYSLLASNRGMQAKDSICIYQLEFENTPVKRAIVSTEEAIEIASLLTKESIVQIVKEPNEYAKMFKDVRSIQRDIAKIIQEINSNRELYNTLADSADRVLLGKKITEGELVLIEQQSKLNAANLLVQAKEMDFLTKGIIIPREDFFKDSSSVSDTSPVKHEMVAKLSNYGSLPQMTILEPVAPIDYTFKVLDTAVIVTNNTIPDGLIYSIQLFLLSNKASLESLKGLSPVFETETPTGKFLYTMGRFSNYEELSAALTVVKALKLNNVISIAYLNGKNISIKEARLMEGKVIDDNNYQIKLDSYPEGIPQPVLDLIRKNTDKDIALKVLEGKNLYFIGPFSNKPEADQLLSLISEIADGASVEAIINADSINNVPEQK